MPQLSTVRKNRSHEIFFDHGPKKVVSFSTWGSLCRFAAICDFIPSVKGFSMGTKGLFKNLGINTWDAMQVVIEWERKDGGLFVSTHITN